MTTIPNLSATDVIVSGDQFVTFKQANGDNRKVAALVLLAYMQANLSLPFFTTQYKSPSVSGETISVTDSGIDIHLLLTPTDGFATMVIVLPLLSTSVDKQEILVTSSKQITSLTINPNGATVSGEPSSMIADGFFKLRYDFLNTTWRRVG
jgi:hypothetical protein